MSRTWKWRAARELRPVAAGVDAREHAELRAGEQQVAVHVILNHGPHIVPIRRLLAMA
jgi:hypothetical protein